MHGCNQDGANPAGPGGPDALPSSGCGVFGQSDRNTGVFGGSAYSHGVHGVNGGASGSTPTVGCGIWGKSVAGCGVFGSSKTGNAAQFHGKVAITGDVEVTGKVTAAGHLSGADLAVSGKITATDLHLSGNFTANDFILSGSDCAEEFDIANSEQLEPGTVVVFDDESSVIKCTRPYDKCVAGVISGAGSFRPGIVLGSNSSSKGRARVALVGRVYCKVDANDFPIAAGDLLTTSSTPGHAMRVLDPSKAFGAIVGKALRPLKSGRGLLPILVTTQ